MTKDPTNDNEDLCDDPWPSGWGIRINMTEDGFIIGERDRYIFNDESGNQIGYIKPLK